MLNICEVDLLLVIFMKLPIYLHASVKGILISAYISFSLLEFYSGGSFLVFLVIIMILLSVNICSTN